jgi:hypothetical protein
MDLHTDDCIICYEPLGLITDIEITQCFHMLHQTCLTRWLRQSQSCPLCRTSIPLSDDSWWGTMDIPGVRPIPNDNVRRRIQIINFESPLTPPHARQYIPTSEPGNARAVQTFDMSREYNILQNYTPRRMIESNQPIFHQIIHVTYPTMTAFQMESVTTTESINTIPNNQKHHYIENDFRLKYNKNTSRNRFVNRGHRNHQTR